MRIMDSGRRVSSDTNNRGNPETWYWGMGERDSSVSGQVPGTGRRAQRATHSCHTQSPLTRQPVPCGLGKLKPCECTPVSFELLEMRSALRG